MEAIVAVYSDWGIGDGQTQPVTLHTDRLHFAEITRGAAVIVGRRTMEDFPGGKPLKGRHNIVITRRSIVIEGAEVVHDTQEALEAAQKQPRSIVIGGASVYRQMFPYISRVYVTKIGCAPQSTAFFPNLDELPDWKCTDAGEQLEENGISCRFCVYERNM